MYHYVRNIENSQYPGIKGLEYKTFTEQIDMFKKEHNFVTGIDIYDCIKHKKDLPQNAIWLTFDDGYKDHYQFVFPYLLENNLKATFFPCVSPVRDKKMLVANKIHYIFGRKIDESSVLDLFSEEVKKHVPLDIRKRISEQYKNYQNSSRYDSKGKSYMKYLLQCGLPTCFRENIIDSMFGNIIGENCKDICKKLYMNMDEMKEMKKNGMEFGIHGVEHLHWGEVEEAVQMKEITDSMTFYKELLIPQNIVVNYPYGSYSKITKTILRRLGIQVGITTNVGIVKNVFEDSLCYPRMNTNDFLKGDNL